MRVALHSGDALQASVDLLVLGVFADGKHDAKTFVAANRALKGGLAQAIEDEEYKGKVDSKLVVPTHGLLRAKRVALVGLGKKADVTGAMAAGLAGSATRLGVHYAAKSVLVVVPAGVGDTAHVLEQLGRGAHLGGYRFDKYRSDKGRKVALATVSLQLEGVKLPSNAEALLTRGQVVAEGVALARNLVNEPPIEIYPDSFAKLAVAEAKKHGLASKVFDEKELKKRGMNLILAVGMGSAKAPRLVHLTYTPKGAAKGKPIVLVGKGITFDSGGLCLKPADSMMDMKVDMGGAAAVLGAMTAIARLKPDVEVHGLMTLAENMPSGTAFRLGDVFTAASGRTVEINNTDAEGRLVLADALHYAVGLKPGRIIDMATLTGACMIALGPHTTGLFSNDDALSEAVSSAGKRVGEDFWRMPLNPALKEMLKSDVADTKNTGERYGGAITAALFLSEFVGKTPWAHLDIAGPVTTKKDAGALAKGATGVPVATLVDLVVA